MFKTEYGVAQYGALWVAFRKHLIFGVCYSTRYIDSTFPTMTWTEDEIRQAFCVTKEKAILQANVHKQLREGKKKDVEFDNVEYLED